MLLRLILAFLRFFERSTHTLPTYFNDLLMQKRSNSIASPALKTICLLSTKIFSLAFAIPPQHAHILLFHDSFHYDSFATAKHKTQSQQNGKINADAQPLFSLFPRFLLCSNIAQSVRRIEAGRDQVKRRIYCIG